MSKPKSKNPKNKIKNQNQLKSKWKKSHLNNQKNNNSNPIQKINIIHKILLKNHII